MTLNYTLKGLRNEIQKANFNKDRKVELKTHNNNIIMNNWFECGVKYTDTEGKKVTEVHLVDAISFTEAEVRLTEMMSEEVGVEFIITKESKSRISEIISDTSGSIWYKCKVNFIETNEKGKETTTSIYVLVRAENITDACTYCHELNADTMADWEIITIQKSKIIDVHPCLSEM